MRKNCIIFLLSIIITLTTLGFSGVFAETPALECAEYLRIHIRADSNVQEAQAVKYRVRDDVVEYLTPLVATYRDKDAAIAGVAAHLDEISALATATLKEYGYSYSATAELMVEEFPTRVYDGCTLPAGKYSALVLKLGSGAGDNWWCVVYPPLCFSTAQNVVYRSKIAEIIADFKNKKVG